MAATSPPGRRISLFHLALAAPWVGLVLDAFAPIGDNSFLWHVRAGEVQAAAGEVLTTDPFSLSLRGTEWVTQSWLAELAYSFLESSFGIGFAAPMMLIAGVITMVGIAIVAFRRSSSIPATAIVVVLSTILFLRFIVPRPALFSYPLFVLVILAWDRKSTRWTLPFLFWVWASVHGSFAIGLAYVALSLVARREWRQWPITLASGLATLLTAHGLGLLAMLRDFATSGAYLDLLSEWRTPDFLEVPLVPVLIGLVVLLYGAMRQRLQPPDLWIIAPFMVLMVSATRAVPTAWLAIVPLVAASLSGLDVGGLRGYPRAAASAALAGILLLPMPFVGATQIDDSRLPVAAAQQLADVPTFHDDVTGGYLIWSETLASGVFLDDRAELYRERIHEFVELRQGREPWRPVFDRDGLTQALLRVSEPLVSDLESSGWVVVYQDDDFVVLLEGGR